MQSSMSDTSEDLQSDKDDSVCRDFVRGICDRKFCKYKHENEIRPLNFCHDFQNNICPRLNCKFIHCTAEEVEEYKRTGEMSNQILAEATRKSQLPGTPPICNQYRKGLCRRANCKFRHVTKEQEEQEIVELIQNNIQRAQGINNNANESHFVGLGSLNGVHRRNGVSYDEYQDSGLPLAKRRFAVAEEILNRELQLEADRVRPSFKGYFAGNPPPGVLNRMDSRMIMLEEENNILHKEVAQLKRQVQDLTATNEFLLDQNANLRVSNKQNAVNMPAVSLTNTNTQQQVIRTVTASVATVPVSLATVTNCNPSIAGCQVSIASPAQILAPSQQILVTTNPAQQLALATSTQQLTSQAQHMANQHLANQQLALANASQQLTTQSQQLALANNPQTHQQLNQQLTTQAQQLANQQLTTQAQQLANQQLTTQAQQLANQQLTSQAQQLALANTTQQLTSQAQQLALANTTQQLTSQAQQLALASAPQQLTSQAQQLALANTTQQLAVASVPPQQLTLANTGQQLLAAQQNLAASTQQMEQLHRNNQLTASINTSQTMAMSNASQPMVSYPIMTQSLNHPMAH